MDADIIFVSYEKTTIIYLSFSQKIFYRKKCTNSYGEPVLFRNDGCCFWKTGMAGMHGFCSCIQLFN